MGEQREGVLRGLVAGGNGGARGDERGVVVVMNLRRRSGRGVVEGFVLVPSSCQPTSQPPSQSPSPSSQPTIILLDEHPLYAPQLPTPNPTSTTQTEEEEQRLDTTFSLGLTEKQRKDREGVVLPYFDAQMGGGAGEGGRILYEMGAEDREDFDDEEDEV